MQWLETLLVKFFEWFPLPTWAVFLLLVAVGIALALVVYAVLYTLAQKLRGPKKKARSPLPVIEPAPKPGARSLTVADGFRIGVGFWCAAAVLAALWYVLFLLLQFLSQP